MYTPRLNQEGDLPTLQRFVRENPLCALVTQTPHGLAASHIPMVLHEEALHEEGSAFGTLRGHVARANPQWREFTASEEALGIFTGPQHFISASWYPGKQTHGEEVPTWNYVAVHVYGSLRVVEDPDWLLAHLRALTGQSEVIAEKPWRVEDAPPEFIADMIRGIVGFELPVTRVEGKWKVSQNRTDEDVAGILEGLTAVGTPAAETMKKLIRSRRPQRPSRD